MPLGAVPWHELMGLLHIRRFCRQDTCPAAMLHDVCPIACALMRMPRLLDRYANEICLLSVRLGGDV